MARRGRENADDRLIVELAAGRTAQEAAVAAGVGSRTVFRRLADPAFQERLSNARKDLLSGAMQTLAESSGAAVATLVKLLDSEADSIRLGAARAILDAGLKLRQAVELEERIRRLEAEEGLTDVPRAYRPA